MGREHVSGDEDDADKDVVHHHGRSYEQEGEFLMSVAEFWHERESWYQIVET